MFTLPPRWRGRLPNLGWLRSRQYADLCEWATPVDFRDSYLLDAFGGVHGLYEFGAPATENLAAEQLKQLQAKLIVLLTRQPLGIDEVEISYLPLGDFQAMARDHGSKVHPSATLNSLRNKRAERLIEECRSGDNVSFTTLLSLGTVPRALGWKGFKDLRLPAFDEEFLAAAPTLNLAEEVTRRWCEGLGWHFDKLSEQAAARVYYGLLNPELAVDLGIPCPHRESHCFMDSWLLHDLDPWVGRGLVRIGQYYHSVVTMHRKPSSGVPRFNEPITTQFPYKQYRFTLRLRRLDQTQERKKLQEEVERAEEFQKLGTNYQDMAQRKTYDADRQNSLNQEAKAAQSEANELIEELRAGEKLIQASASWHLWHRDPEELIRRREYLRSRLADVGEMVGYVEADSPGVVLFQSLPCGGGGLLNPKKIKAPTAANLAPISRGFTTKDDPVVILRNASGGLVPYDPFSAATNAPMIYIAGQMGSGKSALGNHLLCSSYLEGTRLLILDYGGSYDPLAQILGLPVIRFSEKESLTLNPFHMDPGYDPRKAEPTTGQLTRILNNLEMLLLRTDEEEAGVFREEDDRLALDDATRKLVGQAIGKSDAYLTLSKLAEMAGNMSGAEGLRRRLRRVLALGGDFGSWFDGPPGFRLDQPSFVLDLKGISDNKALSRRVIALMVQVIFDVATRERAARKLLVFEEIWHFLRHPGLLDTLTDLGKTARKQGICPISISQSLRDLEGNPAAWRAVQQNTQTYFLFSQGNQEYDAVSRLLKLSQGESGILQSLQRHKGLDQRGRSEIYQECLFVRGEGVRRESGRLRVQFMPEELWLYGTNPKEWQAQQQALQAANGDTWLAVQSLARKHPCGL